jgi:hypothetical protein
MCKNIAKSLHPPDHFFLNFFVRLMTLKIDVTGETYRAGKRTTCVFYDSERYSRKGAQVPLGPQSPLGQGCVLAASEPGSRRVRVDSASGRAAESDMPAQVWASATLKTRSRSHGEARTVTGDSGASLGWGPAAANSRGAASRRGEARPLGCCLPSRRQALPSRAVRRSCAWRRWLRGAGDRKGAVASVKSHLETPPAAAAAAAASRWRLSPPPGPLVAAAAASRASRPPPPGLCARGRRRPGS